MSDRSTRCGHEDIPEGRRRRQKLKLNRILHPDFIHPSLSVVFVPLAHPTVTAAEHLSHPAPSRIIAVGRILKVALSECIDIGTSYALETGEDLHVVFQ